MQALLSGSVRPRSGDLVLARIARLGNHRRLECTDGRRAVLHEDDLIIVAYADRYAPDQYESEVPTSLGTTQLVASGGIASQVLSRSRDVRTATDIVPVGLICHDDGRPLNVADFALATPTITRARPRTIAVVGTSMNSGKTTTVHHLVFGLARAGLRVGATKVTGTGSGNDYWVMRDAGAHRMLDFTDVGLASTYLQPLPRVERKLVELITHLSEDQCDVIFVEVADGLYQKETNALIQAETFRQVIDGVIFAAGDSLGAVHGVGMLGNLGHKVVGISGRITRSPLATREAEIALGARIWEIPDLEDAGARAVDLGLRLPPAAARVPQQTPWEAPAFRAPAQRELVDSVLPRQRGE